MDSVQHQHSPEGEYINNQWVDLGGMHQTSHGHHSHHSSSDFGLYGFVESSQIPSEASFRLQHGSTQPSYYTQLPQWSFPSSGQQSFMPVSNAIPVQNGRPSVPPVSHTPSTTTPRRTLTDLDRRKMCIFHEENPTVKQTEIGAMFGVERSTVSKVLRQKEKYLHPEDGSKSPVKRSKGKFPDIERALSNWAKNTRKHGHVLTDAMIREKARFFAQSCGMSESHFKANSPTWLEKFKMKNNLQARNNSSDSDSRGISPVRGHHSRSASLQSLPSNIASPMSNHRSHDSQCKESPDSFIDFNFKGFQPSSGTPSLSSIYSEQNANSHSVFTSPTSPMFSPTDSPLFPSQQARLPPIQQQRPRSQSYPHISPDPIRVSSPSTGDSSIPRQLNRSSTLASASSLSNTTIPEEDSLDDESKLTRRSSMSNSSHKRSNPSKEDARQALELVMSFLKQQPMGCVEADDFATVGKLLDRFAFGGSPSTDNLPDISSSFRMSQDQVNVATEIATSN